MGFKGEFIDHLNNYQSHREVCTVVLLNNTTFVAQKMVEFATTKRNVEYISKMFFAVV
jgi:hypothetical protein